MPATERNRKEDNSPLVVDVDGSGVASIKSTDLLEKKWFREQLESVRKYRKATEKHIAKESE